ncbi:MAG: nitrilase-related carbon-nitrogen hydrolase [Desulfobacteraceae bacterium]
MTVLPIGVAGGHGICHGLSDSYYRQLLQDYTRKRNWLSDALSDMGFKVYPCDGTYYLLADITTLGFDAVQMDIVWHDRHANHAHAWDLAAAAKASDVDLVVFPEMFSTGFSMDTDVIAEAKDGSTPTLLRSMARELNIKDRKPHFFK